MIKIDFIGKTLLIEYGKGKDVERALVIGDLHLGYEEVMRSSGILVPSGIYEEIIKEMDAVFDFIGKKRVDKIILLGDLRHEFGKILRSEWKEVHGFIDYLRGKIEDGGEIVIVKGNHDTMTKNIIKRKGIDILDYYLWKEFVFLHGNKEFKEIYYEKIKYWIMGHAHPAVTLQDKNSVKKEKYKCFLVGKWKRKEVIIVPSFFPIIEGSDIRNSTGKDIGLAWDFKIENFNVRIIEGEKSLDVLNFGKLSKLKS